MANVIKTLQQDHRNIFKLLEMLEQQVDNFAAGEYADYQVMTDIMHYFVNYPDIYHHPYEDIIFEVLKKKDVTTADQIDEIVAEHQIMAAESSALLDAMIQIQGNAISSREEIANRLKKYIADYHSHIRKEEENLFLPAQKTFNDNDWGDVEKEMVKAEDPLFGKILDDEYKGLYKLILAEEKESEA